jgi:hypothetical protein
MRHAKTGDGVKTRVTENDFVGPLGRRVPFVRRVDVGRERRPELGERMQKARTDGARLFRAAHAIDAAIFEWGAAMMEPAIELRTETRL